MCISAIGWECFSNLSYEELGVALLSRVKSNVFCIDILLKTEDFERGLLYIWICVVSKTSCVSAIIHFDWECFPNLSYEELGVALLSRIKSNMFSLDIFLKTEDFERGLSYIWICIVSKTKCVSAIINFGFSLFI
jgi:uncharacterized protein (DUF4213/DUF364 family)